MDEKITILGSYDVYIGPGILTKLSRLVNLKNYSNIVIITDKSVKNHWLKEIEKVLPGKLVKIVLQPGEQSKDIQTVQKIWHKFFLSGCDRKTLVINLGGGVVSDVGGFAAATYMRGIDFMNIPTTLVAQVDAGIGGKTGIDFAGIKNLIGTFNQPITVICDINLLSTLPDREFIAGFGEIIKHGLIADRKYFAFVTSKKPGNFSKQELTKIVFGSIKIKADIISEDEKETDKRRLLNFGHTIGHAIEALSQKTNNPLLHGEAVSIGMVTEGQISKLLGLLSNEEYKQLEQSVIQAGLPTKTSGLEVNKILEKIKSDKKNEKGNINWTLLKGIGKAIYNQKVDDLIIRKAL